MADLTLTDTMIKRSDVFAGNTARLQAAFTRAEEGKPIKVVVLGGSITQGAMATSPAKCYGSLVADWWKKTFPKADVSFVNAGIGATGSDLGACRVWKDVVATDPDFVVVEFAVNDPADDFHARTYEGVIRQLLVAQKQPAVMLLFMMNENGQNAQAKEEPVGKHYDLPMVSYRDAVWPEIEAGRLKWTDISPDSVHPNDSGHAAVAKLIEAALKRAMAATAGKAQQPILPMPAPLYGDVWDRATLLSGGALQPTANEGWKQAGPWGFGKGWEANQPGQTISFRVPGSDVAAIFWRIKGPMGHVSAKADGQAPAVLDGYFDATWGGYTPFQLVGSDLGAGEHTVTFTVAPDSDKGSGGHQFQLHALGLAGLPRVPIVESRGGLPNVFARVEAGKPINVAYFGGSITESGGSNGSKGWRSLTTAWLRRRFPGAQINEIQAAIGGTGSDLGAFRLQHDVLAYKPNLVFVEFAVNDGGQPPALIRRDMEGIVRHIWSEDPTCDICFVYTTVLGWINDFRTGELPASQAADEDVAAHYGIPSVNVGAAAANDILAGKIGQLVFAPDTVHPGDAGYVMYAKTVTDYLQTQTANPQPMPHVLPAPLTPDCLQDAEMYDATTSAQVVSGWKVDDKAWVGRFKHVLASDTPGAELKFAFEGKTLGLYYELGPDTGNFEWRVDGGKWQEVSPFDQWAKQYARPSYRVLTSSLAAGKHVLELRISANKSPDSKGTFTRLGYFLVGKE